MIEVTVISVSLAAILSGWVIVCVNSMIMPLYDIDSFTLWGLKAKVLFYSGLDKTGYFTDQSFGFSHLDYPLMQPCLTAGAYAAMGFTSEQAGKIIMPLFHIGFILLLFSSSAKFVNWKTALLLTAAASVLTPIMYWGSNGTVDVMLAVFYAGSLFYMASFLDGGDVKELIFAMLFTLFLIFTKNEGYVLAFINCLVFLIFVFHRNRDGIRPVLVCCLFLVLASLPWFIWNIDVPKIHENYSGRISLVFNPDNISRIDGIAVQFAKAFLNVDRWGIFWLLPLISLVALCGGCRDRKVIFLWILFLLHLLLYVFIFVISPWDTVRLSEMVTERLFIHLVPLAFYIFIFSLKEDTGSN